MLSFSLELFHVKQFLFNNKCFPRVCVAAVHYRGVSGRLPFLRLNIKQEAAATAHIP
jgi:hypothetical protein